jgi:hypothetical protein
MESVSNGLFATKSPFGAHWNLGSKPKKRKAGTQPLLVFLALRGLTGP